MRFDVWALVLSYIYVFAVIMGGEGLRRWRRYSVDFTRKFIHVGVGLWIIGTVALFRNRYLAMIPPLSFVLINYISYRREMFKAMETGESGNLGTVYFPLSFAVLIFWLWERPALLVASLMPMTLGDAAAALVGERLGRHRLWVRGSQKSWEGSVAMFLVSLVAMWLTLGLMSAAGWGNGLWLAVVVALLAAVVEALTPWRMDNLTVPFVSALLLALQSIVR